MTLALSVQEVYIQASIAPLAKTAGLLGVGVNMYQVYDGFENGGLEGAGHAGFDALVTTALSFSGSVGLGLALGYDYLGGAQEIQQTEQIQCVYWVNKSWDVKKQCRDYWPVCFYAIAHS